MKMSMKSFTLFVALAVLVSSALISSAVFAAPAQTAHRAAQADLSTDVVERISVDSAGLQGDAASDFTYPPSFSADGRYVAFSSKASNLVAGDTNGVEDVFVRDRDLQTTTRISTGPGAVEGNAASILPSISPDGRYVGFSSSASNLVAGDTNAFPDTFLYDRQTGLMIRLSMNGAQEGNSQSNQPTVSPDGNYWVFISWASNLVANDTNGVADVFLYSMSQGTLTRFSVDSSGVEGNGDSTVAAVSNGGRYVAFKSAASNLVTGDTNGKADIFRHDTQTGTTIRLSVGNSGNESNGDSYRPMISADGRYIAFMSDASNLAAGDTNAVSDTFVRDSTLNTTVRVSVGDYGQQGNGASYDPAISSDGRYVEFASSASNLVTGDTNAANDIFVRDLQTGSIRRVSVSASGAQADGASDGRASFAVSQPYLVYTSSASNLTVGDTNAVVDVFAVDFGVLMSRPYVTSTASLAAQDGWVLESSETSSLGGTLNSAAATFNLGDDAARKQYRGILSFSTGPGLPDSAVITKVTLKVMKQGIVGGGNPVATFGGFMADVRNGFFGTTSALQAADFQAAASASYGPFMPALAGNWYTIDLTAAKAQVNKLATGSGLTQIRLRFKLDDNNNAIANYLSLYSGNAPAGSQPQLVITYYVP